MGFHTKNEIYPLGGRRPAPQAGAWSYSRRENGTDWQEGDASPLGSGLRMKPHNRQWRTEGKLSLHCHQLKGALFQISQALLAIGTSSVNGGF